MIGGDYDGDVCDDDDIDGGGDEIEGVRGRRKCGRLKLRRERS